MTINTFHKLINELYVTDITAANYLLNNPAELSNLSIEDLFNRKIITNNRCYIKDYDHIGQLDENNNIINFPSGEYNLYYEDINGNILNNFDVIIKNHNI